jgi:transposase
MRGSDEQQGAMFSYLSPEQRVPKNHPLRPIREMTDRALRELSSRFDEIYSAIGRPSKAPEKLLRALLLQLLYSVRSERMLMEELDYNLLFRWFVGLNMDEEVWDPTVFTKNRDRLLEGEVASAFFKAVLAQAEEEDLTSDEHFTVDGTLIEAWAGQKSFKRKPEERGGTGGREETGKDETVTTAAEEGSNPTVNFHGEKRSNETHQSTTDPEARLYKKGRGKEAKLGYLGHLLMENRNGLVVGACVTLATGTAEREAGVEFAKEISGQGVTLGSDKAYDTKAFVEQLRALGVTPHVAQNENERRSSAIDGRTTRHPGYGISQRKRKRVEEIFGWIKTVASLRKTKHRGVHKVEWVFTFATAAYNLVRIRNLRAV